MNRFTRLGVGLALLAGALGCDQATKRAAVAGLKGSGTVSWAGDLFRLHYAENRGAFLGLGQALPASWRFWLLTVGVGLLLLGALVAVVLNTSLSRPRYAGLVLFAAGGLGNWVDRVAAQGMVVDFMNLGIGSVRTGIFNVADVAILVGALLVAWPERARWAAPASLSG